MHVPHKIKNLKRISRIVILPDYQGIGIGTQVVDFFGEYYKKLGYKLSIVTSAKNMIFSLKSNPKWRMSRYGYVSQHSNKTWKVRKSENCWIHVQIERRWRYLKWQEDNIRSG